MVLGWGWGCVSFSSTFLHTVGVLGWKKNKMESLCDLVSDEDEQKIKMIANFCEKIWPKKATKFYIIFIAITVNCAKIYLDNRHFAQNLQCACFSLLAHNNAIIKWFLITWIVFKYTVFILIWSHYHLIYIDNPHKHNCNCNYNCSKFRPDHIMKHLSHASILDCNKFGWYRPNVLKPHFAQFLKIEKSYFT